MKAYEKVTKLIVGRKYQHCWHQDITMEVLLGPDDAKQFVGLIHYSEGHSVYSIQTEVPGRWKFHNEFE